jgi:hypothetical protein
MFCEMLVFRTGELVSLSEQELVDCDSRDAGCNGGLPENAYKTLLEIGGLESEAEYGYDGEDEQCKFNRYTHIEQEKLKIPRSGLGKYSETGFHIGMNRNFVCFMAQTQSQKSSY